MCASKHDSGRHIRHGVSSMPSKTQEFEATVLPAASEGFCIKDARMRFSGPACLLGSKTKQFLFSMAAEGSEPRVENLDLNPLILE